MERTFGGILEIPEDMGYWLVRADGGKYYEDFFLNNFIAVSDNEITLEDIKDSAKGAFVGITVDHYKELYREKYQEWKPQQIAHSAGRTFKFIEEMKIGDLVLVPSKNSNRFLMGILTSDVYEITEKDLMVKVEVNYSINPFYKRRSVQWVKEISRKEISEKLYWILSAHQTIFNLLDQKEYVNQLLAPIYVQNGLCHGTIKISKKEGITSNEWFELYSIIKSKSDNVKDEVIVKSNVQSPGLIEFISNNYMLVISTATVLSGIVFGEINTAGVKLKGILPYFQTRKKENVEIKKFEKEIELMDEEKAAKQIENEKSQFELDKEREIWEVKKLENEVERLRLQLQISSFDAGRIVESQTQTDSGGDPGAAES